MGQNDVSLVLVMGVFCVKSAIGTKAELLMWTACVGMIGEASRALTGTWCCVLLSPV